VALRFRPVDDTFFDMLTDAARHLVVGADLVSEMLGSTDVTHDRPGVALRMREQEHLADETTHDIIRKVNKTFVTPFDREDIYALASALDDVMDDMEEAVDLTVLYDVQKLPDGVADQVEVLRRCADVCAEAMPRLRTMKDLDEFWIEINRLENAGDKSYRLILAHLFSGEYDALDVLKLKDVVDSLEAAIDGFEKVANIVEQISVKES
jgi:predicted phosphate transport protein (TIGR00153 family)